MDDLTVTQLLARMDAHKDRANGSILVAEMDADLARQDLYMAEMTTTLREQHARMRQMAQTLADTSRFLDEARGEASQQHATPMQALEAAIARPAGGKL